MESQWLSTVDYVMVRGEGISPTFPLSRCPASPEKEDQRAAGSPAALTQLALCLRLAIDLKGRKLATRLNPQWKTGMACPTSLLRSRHHRQVKLAVKT